MKRTAISVVAVAAALALIGGGPGAIGAAEQSASRVTARGLAADVVPDATVTEPIRVTAQASGGS